jgi:hypothetical protein
MTISDNLDWTLPVDVVGFLADVDFKTPMLPRFL